MNNFIEFPKIARLSRNCVITEKIDGTNASIWIPETPQEAETLGDKPFLVGSRTRWITPQDDNFGFARWAYDNATELWKLGPGHHFGEWWGSGIQRKYGLDHKRFSLFNTRRWADRHMSGIGSMPIYTGDNPPNDKQQWAPECCYVVPILYHGLFEVGAVNLALTHLATSGSAAAPGFMKPEGVVVYHEAACVMFKKTIEKDTEYKGQSR